MLPSRPEEDGFLHLGMPGTGILTVIMIAGIRMIIVIVRILIVIILARIIEIMVVIVITVKKQCQEFIGQAIVENKLLEAN